jgi:hypothetical protein
MFHAEHSEKQAQKSPIYENVPRGTFAKNRKKYGMFHVEHSYKIGYESKTVIFKSRCPNQPCPYGFGN